MTAEGRELPVVGAWHPTTLKSKRVTRSGTTSLGKSELFHLAAGLLHQFGPAQRFLADERCELRRRVSHGLEIDHGELLLYVGKLHDARELAVPANRKGAFTAVIMLESSQHIGKIVLTV